MKKHQDLLYIEELFTEIKANNRGDNRSYLSSIQRVLKRRYDINATIEIIDTTEHSFFGMSIYPEMDVIEVILQQMIEKNSRIETIEKLWAKNKHWHIEIDSRLLYDPRINANPQEITSVLLHEIGHTVLSNTVPVRVHRVISYGLMQVPVKVKKMFNWSKTRKLLGLSVIEACSLTSFNTTNSTLKEELEADKFAVKEGYGEHLQSFLNKLLTAEGNKYFDVTNNEAEKEISLMVQWAVVNTAELQHRRNKLQTSIQDALLTTPSSFTKKYIKSIKETFFDNGKGNGRNPRFEEAVNEQMLIKQIGLMSDVTEGFRDWFSKTGEIKKISQADIDIISIELNRIENEDDRLYVLDLIYNKLDLVTTSLDFLEDEKLKTRVKSSKFTLEKQRDQLNKLRSDVLKLKVRPVQYGVLIKYPDGYEG